MVDLLYELGASLDIKNRQGLTPLTLAAVKARKEVSKEKKIFFLMLNFVFRSSIIFYKKFERFIGNMEMSHVQVIL